MISIFGRYYNGNMRRGDLVEVLPYSQIRKTLDEKGQLNNMPFMPEMLKYCGRRFRIHKLVNYVCVEGKRMSSLTRTFTLDKVYCDGSGHDNCQKSCTIFWKEEWLKPCSDTSGKIQVAKAPAKDANPYITFDEKENRYICQSTQLSRAATEMKGFSKIYHLLKELLTGNRKFGKFLLDFLTYIIPKLFKGSKSQSCKILITDRLKTPSQSLNLQPGDWVEVKSKEEIRKTLDKNGKNRGLAFIPEMYPFCGKKFRVWQRLDFAISEESGHMMRMKNTVLLEEVKCFGICTFGCSKNLHHWWREIWLSKV